jgi:hypothetical protein
MPNWCDNTIKVTGPADKLALFVSKATGGEGLLSSLFPMPENKEQRIEESAGCYLLNYSGGADDLHDQTWYYWNVHNWGTKWDIPQKELHQSEYTPGKDAAWEASFQSAWSPPVEWLTKVAKDYPYLDFDLEYMELGNWYAGHAVGSNGIVNNTDGEPEDFTFCEEQVDYINQMNAEEEEVG